LGVNKKISLEVTADKAYTFISRRQNAERIHSSKMRTTLKHLGTTLTNQNQVGVALQLQTRILEGLG
jgi:hypothetical protein